MTGSTWTELRCCVEGCTVKVGAQADAVARALENHLREFHTMNEIIPALTAGAARWWAVESTKADAAGAAHRGPGGSLECCGVRVHSSSYGELMRFQDHLVTEHRLGTLTQGSAPVADDAPAPPFTVVRCRVNGCDEDIRSTASGIFDALRNHLTVYHAPEHVDSSLVKAAADLWAVLSPAPDALPPIDLAMPDPDPSRRPSVLYRPTLKFDGEVGGTAFWWTATYGDVRATGDTPGEAMDAFDRAWKAGTP